MNYVYLYAWDILQFISMKSFSYFSSFVFAQFLIFCGGCSVQAQNVANSRNINEVFALCYDSIEAPLDFDGEVAINFEDIDNGSYADAINFSYQIQPLQFECGNIGYNDIMLIISDTSSSDTCFSTVNIIDTLSPEIICDSELIFENDSGICSAQLTIPAPSVSDNCIEFTLSHNYSADPLPQGEFPVGTTSIIWLAEDASGHQASCTVDIVVTDEESPVAICVDSLALSLNGNNQMNIEPEWIDNESFDNCGIVNLTVNPQVLTIEDIGYQSVSLTVTDASGNSNQCQAILNLTSDSTISAECKDAAVFLDEFGSVTVNPLLIDNGSTSSSTIVSYVVEPAVFTCAELGPNQIELTVTDSEGLQASCTSMVAVGDSIPPALFCDSLIQASNQIGLCEGYVQIGPPQVVENCNYTLSNSYNQTGSASDVYTVGTTSVTWTAIDLSDNSSTCTQVIQVNDTEFPVAICQDSVVLLLDDNNQAQLFLSDINNGSEDNCFISSYVISQALFSLENLGFNSVDLLVSDEAGNSASCSTLVEVVVVSQNPEAKCRNIEVALDESGQVMISPEDIDDGSTSQNPLSEVVVEPQVLDCRYLGESTVYLKLTDVNGLVGQCTSVVTVVDNLPPQIICAPIEFSQSGFNTYSIVLDSIYRRSSDNCAIQNYQVVRANQTGSQPYLDVRLTDVSEIIIECRIPVLISENPCPSEMVVYPNPVSGIFYLNVKGSVGVFRLEFIDYTGKVAAQQMISISTEDPQPIDPAGLSPGLYSLRVINVKGDCSIATKIVISNSDSYR